MTTLAIIGKGKTGGEVLKSLQENESPIVFDQSHPVTVEKLRAADAAVIFVPGHVVPEIIDTVLESGIPAVWGSTGFVWPSNLAAKLTAHQTRWVIANNFSPVMVLIQKMLEMIGETAPELLNQADYHIHEVHHIHKKDQPSGTALSWQEWFGLPCDITSERVGDVKGIHEFTLKTPTETLTIHHDVHDRRVFAEGALTAARYLLKHPHMAPGLYRFYDLFKGEAA